MKIIIGVSFRQAGKVYFFDPGDEQIERGEHVIVETAKGVEYGTVVVPNREMAEEKIVAPLKKIIRVPGQAVVLYQGDVVLGGGTITQVAKG